MFTHRYLSLFFLVIMYCLITLRVFTHCYISPLYCFSSVALLFIRFLTYERFPVNYYLLNIMPTDAATNIYMCLVRYYTCIFVHYFHSTYYIYHSPYTYVVDTRTIDLAWYFHTILATIMPIRCTFSNCTHPYIEYLSSYVCIFVFSNHFLFVE